MESALPNHREWRSLPFLFVFFSPLNSLLRRYRISIVNAQYEVCATYPFMLVTPSSVTDDTLRACGKFRSKGRLVALTWRHPTSGATLSRCAQPLVGLGLAGALRSEADEMLIRAIREASGLSSLHIVDCRHLLNAQANKMTGGGTENVAFYPKCSLEQLDLVNIHKVRDAFDALQSCCMQAIKAEYSLTENGVVVVDDGKFWGALDQSRWLQTIVSILRGALKIATILSGKNVTAAPVLVHCR